MLLAAAFLLAAPGAAGDKDKAAKRGRAATADRTDKHADVTYGRIKEFNAGRKIVIDLDNAADKSFDLTEAEPRVTIASGLQVGDPVKVMERDRNGKKTVQIVKHSGGNVPHGDRRSTADRAERNADVTYGRVKEFSPGQRIVVDVDNAPDKAFDLTDTDTRVNIAAGLEVGEPIKVTERDVNGRKIVNIVKHTGGNVKHGDADRSEKPRH